MPRGGQADSIDSLRRWFGGGRRAHVRPAADFHPKQRAGSVPFRVERLIAFPLSIKVIARTSVQ